jgi:hypothetical protein
MANTTIQGFGGGFSMAGFTPKFNSWTATANFNPTDTSGFVDENIYTREGTMKMITGTATGVCLNNAGNTIQGDLGNVTLPTGCNLKVSAWTATFDAKLTNTTGFVDGYWYTCTPVKCGLTVDLTSMQITEGQPMPTTMWTTNAAKFINLVLTASTASTITCPSLVLNTANIVRPSDDKVMYNMNLLADDYWTMNWAANYPVNSAAFGISGYSGFTQSAFVGACVLTQSGTSNLAFNACASRVTLSRSVDLGAYMTFSMDFTSTGAITCT